MKSFSENYQCDCGTQFEWKTLFLQSGEGVFGRWDDMQKNVIRKSMENEVYHITIRCPKCGKTHFIIKE